MRRFPEPIQALVTPFAARALDRALSALLVSLVRLSDSEWNENRRAGAIEREHARVLRALEAIRNRAAEATFDKEYGLEVAKMLERRLDEWLSRARRAGGTNFSEPITGYWGWRTGSTWKRLPPTPRRRRRTWRAGSGWMVFAGPPGHRQRGNRRIEIRHGHPERVDPLAAVVAHEQMQIQGRDRGTAVA